MRRKLRSRRGKGVKESVRLGGVVLEGWFSSTTSTDVYRDVTETPFLSFYRRLGVVLTDLNLLTKFNCFYALEFASGWTVLWHDL